MIYVFDSSSFIVAGHYFPESFPSFWANFGRYVSEKRILSVKEARAELEFQNPREHLKGWVKANPNVFQTPGAEETSFVAEIFSIPHFQQAVSQKNLLQGRPVADPFVIALAKVKTATVVTEEQFRPNAAKIPNICAHFRVPYVTLEGFMAAEKWSF